MTTPSHPGPPPPYPPGAAPSAEPAPAGPPPPPWRRRTTSIVVALGVLASGAVVWWLTRNDGSSLADRPRVKDGKAGISFALPEGWRDERIGLIDAFTSAATGRAAEGTRDDGLGAGSLLAGRGGAVTQSGLRRVTERSAASNAVFFCPDGRATIQESKATTVDERPAHTVVMKVTGSDCGELHLRMNVVAVDDTRSGFLLGITDGTETANSRLIDDVLADMSLT
ncbi:hypothetical protein ACH41E_07045 [Streptomyces sp. NPDC020412]|uniref:hypothetical protein n=1 Tax=Streptomyces sp. NPDC020412 TaxID=3365073 RepID=UPI003796A06C